ncbi:MAG: hypothetical protein KatS3mg027_0487 [Bacteroidia bacterium]|nr:MAG: hypothetical protein KatS3mg027_0487 [Bacteroidia bacterium]
MYEQSLFLYFYTLNLLRVSKSFWKIISIVLGLGALGVLVHRLYATFSIHQVQEIFQIIVQPNSLGYFFLIVILMPVNWLIECWKWYKVSNVVEKNSFFNAVKSLLVGMAYGHLLPGRSSEFLGKIMFYSEKNKSNIIVLHFVNAAFQMYVTILVGLFFLIMYYGSNLFSNQYFQIVVIITMLLLFLVSGIVFYGNKLNVLKKFMTQLDFNIENTLKVELLLFSFLRYFVFILQFLMVFKIFHPEIELNMEFIARISFYFLVTSVIPMISVIEVAVRSLIGIFIFEQWGMNEWQITTMVSIIWLINLVLPSIMGFIIGSFYIKHFGK